MMKVMWGLFVLEKIQHCILKLKWYYLYQRLVLVDGTSAESSRKTNNREPHMKLKAPYPEHSPPRINDDFRGGSNSS